MNDTPKDPLEDPKSIRRPNAERRDGRPSTETDEGIGAGIPQRDAETVAPEEKGRAPTTEHAPGADL